MEKNIRICFLVPIAIGICLIGSTFSAQSKVAESPGADLLHRFSGPTVSPHSGDTHRGGDFRPDTFLSIGRSDEVTHPTSVIPHPMSSIGHPTSDTCTEQRRSIGHPTSDIGHRTSGTCTELRRSISSAHEIDGGPIVIGPWSVSGLRHCEKSPSTVGEGLDEAISSEEAVFPSMRLPRRPLGAPRSDVHDTAVVGELGRTVVSELSRTVDRGPNLPSPVSRLLPPNDRQNIPETSDTESLDSFFSGLESSGSLVDNSTSQDREGEIPSASGEVLIYGELINPDSLSPLNLDFSEVFLSQGMALSDSSFQIHLQRGTFFDGVLDPRAQKFQARIPVGQGPVLLSLTLGQRNLMQDYLAYAGDSIKIGIDLQDYTLVFAGPQASWFEAQYAAKRAQASARFGEARMVLEDDREGLLAQADNRAQMLAQDTVFGARIAIHEFGRDGLDLEREILLDTSRRAIPGWTALRSYKGRIPEDRLDFLESQLLGAHYARHLATLRKYHYGMPLALGDSVSALRAKSLFPEILAKLDADLSAAMTQGLSPGALDLAREWSATWRQLADTSLEEAIIQKYPSPVRERLLLSSLRRSLRLGGITVEEWDFFAEVLGNTELASAFESLMDTFRPGMPLAPAKFRGLGGELLSLADFRGKPTLLYFYFSTCVHSGNYFRNYLWPIYQEIGEEAGLQLVAVSVDRDPELWRSEIPNYSSPEILNLNLPEDHAEAWLNRYQITAYPRTMLLDPEGKVLSHSLSGTDYEDYKSRILFLLHQDQPISPLSHP